MSDATVYQESVHMARWAFLATAETTTGGRYRILSHEPQRLARAINELLRYAGSMR